VVGRITERQLPLAEKCFPGICRLYEQMPEKPLTFLQLLWAYEGRRATAAPRSRRGARRRRA
jgi:hypothetical protein